MEYVVTIDAVNINTLATFSVDVICVVIVVNIVCSDLIGRNTGINLFPANIFSIMTNI